MRNSNVLEVPATITEEKGRESKVGTACVCRSLLTAAFVVWLFG